MATLNSVVLKEVFNFLNTNIRKGKFVHNK